MSSSSRRGLLQGLGALALLTSAARAAEAPPNILFILADDMGYADLSGWGARDWATPHHGRMASAAHSTIAAPRSSSPCTIGRSR